MWLWCFWCGMRSPKASLALRLKHTQTKLRAYFSTRVDMLLTFQNSSHIWGGKIVLIQLNWQRYRFSGTSTTEESKHFSFCCDICHFYLMEVISSLPSLSKISKWFLNEHHYIFMSCTPNFNSSMESISTGFLRTESWSDFCFSLFFFLKEDCI